MEQLLFITGNKKKLEEVNAMLGDKYKIISLKDIEWEEDIPEPYDTIKENAIHKAKYFYEKTQMNCMSEDSGLEVDALDGAPGAFSARYAGEEKSDTANNIKLLAELENVNDRSARFRSVFCLALDGNFEVFDGTMEGNIALEPKGNSGFGYDPIFVSEGSQKTNAELTMEEKNAISHRSKSLKKLVDYLNS